MDESASDGAAPPLRTLVPYAGEESISIREAATIAGKSERTLRNWCVKHGIGLHERAENFRCLLVARKNLAPEFDEPRAHRWIGQRLNGGSIEPTDYFPWRSPRREEADPLDV